MNEKIDIHNFPRKMEKLKDLLANGGVSSSTPSKTHLSKRTCDLILSYERTRALNGIKLSTRCADVHRLLTIARLTNKDLDKLSKEDVKSLVAQMNERYSQWTSMKLRMNYKNFFKWAKQGDDYLDDNDNYPEEVKWIRRNLKRVDLPKIRESDCWTEQEINKLLSVIEHPRDKVLVSILTETGARVGEIGGLRIGDVYQDEFSFLLHVSGKTGERDPRVIYSGPHLAEWLNIHPEKDNPGAPLFPNLNNSKPLSYHSIELLFNRLVQKAGLQKKKSNPHIFRHSKATQLASQGWPEPLIKEYLGWQKDSDMMSTYSHITSKQANRYLLKKHGIVAEEKHTQELTIQVCATCHEENSPESKFCKKCGRPLSHRTILQYNDTKNKASKILDRLIEKPGFVEMLEHFMAEEENSKA